MTIEVALGARRTLVSPLHRLGRQSPCRGICSTTYGDSVCRGCKRFSHEVLSWNQLKPTQKERIWSRLTLVYVESINACVRIADRALLDRWVGDRLTTPPTTVESQIYELLQVVDVLVLDLGLRPTESNETIRAPQLFQEIEDEIYSRSLAYFQYYFKRPIDQI